MNFTFTDKVNPPNLADIRKANLSLNRLNQKNIIFGLGAMMISSSVVIGSMGLLSVMPVSTMAFVMILYTFVMIKVGIVQMVEEPKYLEQKANMQPITKEECANLYYFSNKSYIADYCQKVSLQGREILKGEYHLLIDEYLNILVQYKEEQNELACKNCII